MTVAAKSPFKEYVENGETTSFGVPFRFKDPRHVVAQRIAADGSVTELAYGVDYSVSGGQDDAGGVLLSAAAAMAGVRLQIRRVTPRVQAMDYAAADTFPAESHELALDNGMLVDQEQDVAIGALDARAVKVPVGESAPVLPAAADRAGTFLAFDADGNPIPAVGTGGDAALRSDLAQPNGKDLIGGIDTMAEQAADDVDISGGRVSAALATTSFRRPGFYNFGGDCSPTWSAAFAASICGELFSTYDMQVTPVGDLTARCAILSNSVGVGVGTNGILQTDLLVNAWPTVVAELLSEIPGVSAQANGVFGDHFFGLAGLPAADPRISFDAGWAIHPTLFCLGGRAFYDPYTDTSGAELTYDPGVPTKTLDVYAIAFPGYANFIVTVGGFFVGSGATDGPANVIRYVFDRSVKDPGYAGTDEDWWAEPWVIRKAGGFLDKDLLIAGVEAYTASERKISIANMSASGSRTDHFASDNQPYSFRNALRRYAPHLSIIAININNCAANTPKAQFMAEYQVMIDAAHRTGDVWLAIDNPVTDTLAPFARQQLFADYVYELADANTNGGGRGLPVISFLDRWIAEDLAPNRGLFADGVHPTKRGARGDLARVYAQAIGHPGYHFA